MNWIRQFFAVDNQVNEDTVAGVFWGMVAFVFFVLRAVGIVSITDEMLYMTLGASLAALGIGGFKR
jgi:uncharacterized membrane protein